MLFFTFWIRNRLHERQTFVLPLNQSAHDDGADFDELGLSQDEITYMVEHRTLELPANFFRRRITRSSQFSTLEYVAFRVRDKFPNNIVRLRDGSIMYVTKFITESPTMDDDGEDETNGAALKKEHYLSGHLFNKVYYKCCRYIAEINGHCTVLFSIIEPNCCLIFLREDDEAMSIYFSYCDAYLFCEPKNICKM